MWIRIPWWAGGGWIIFITTVFISPYAQGAVRRKQETAYVADPAGIPLSKPDHGPSKVGSPASLIQPDRYEFYTFDESGELIKRLMTLAEIQDIIATGDGEDGHVLTIAQTDLNKPAVTFNFQPPSHTKVHTIVSNVQNVLKAEMEAHKSKPPNETVFDTPDVSSSWSQILPAIFGNTGGNIAPDNFPQSHFGPETDVITKTEEALTESSQAFNKNKETTPIVVLDEPNDELIPPLEAITDIDKVINSFAQAEDLLDDDFSNFASKTTDDIIPSDFIELSTTATLKKPGKDNKTSVIDLQSSDNVKTQNYSTVESNSSLIKTTANQEEIVVTPFEQVTEKLHSQNLITQMPTEKTVTQNDLTTKKNILSTNKFNNLSSTSSSTEQTSETSYLNAKPASVKPLNSSNLNVELIAHSQEKNTTKINEFQKNPVTHTTDNTHVKISSSNLNKIKNKNPENMTNPIKTQNLVAVEYKNNSNAITTTKYTDKTTNTEKPKPFTEVNIIPEVVTEHREVYETKEESSNYTASDLDIDQIISQIANNLNHPADNNTNNIIINTSESYVINNTQNEKNPSPTEHITETITTNSPKIINNDEINKPNNIVQLIQRNNTLNEDESTKYEKIGQSDNSMKNKITETNKNNNSEELTTLLISHSDYITTSNKNTYLDDVTTTNEDLVVTKQSLSDLSDSITNLLSQIAESPETSITNIKNITYENLSTLETHDNRKNNTNLNEKIIEKPVNNSNTEENTTNSQSIRVSLIPTESTLKVTNKNNIESLPPAEVEKIIEKIKTTELADTITTPETNPTTYRPKTTTVKIESVLPSKIEKNTQKPQINKVESIPQELKTAPKIKIHKTSTVKYKSTESVSTEKIVSTTTEKTKQYTKNNTPLRISLLTEKLDTQSNLIKHTTPITKTEPFVLTTQKNGASTQDDELMAMLNKYSEMFNISPGLESKSDDSLGEILSSKKNTYKKTDVLEDELLPITNIKEITKIPNTTFKRTDQSVISEVGKNNTGSESSEKKEVTKKDEDKPIKRNNSKSEITKENYVTGKPLRFDDLKQKNENSSNSTKNINVNDTVTEKSAELVEIKTESHNSNITQPANVKGTSTVSPKLNISNDSTTVKTNVSKDKVMDTVENKYQITPQNENKSNILDTKNKIELIPTNSRLEITTNKPILVNENNQEKEFNTTTIKNDRLTSVTADVNKLSSIPQSKPVNNVTTQPNTVLDKIAQFNNDSKETIINKTIDNIKKINLTINQNDKNKHLNTHQNTWKLISPPSPKENNTKVNIPNTQSPEYNPSISNIQNTNKNAQLSYIDRIHLPGLNGGEGLERTTSNLNEDVYQFSELCNELGFRYWNAVVSNGIDPKRTVFISPFALTSVLAMLFMATRGSTSEEMNDILKLDEMVTFNPHIVFKNVTESIEVSKRAGVATSAFVRELYSDQSKGRLLSFYKDRVQKFYNGHVEEVNFSSIGDIIRKRTNLLVKRQTWSKITEYIKQNNLILKPPLSVFSANIFQTDCSTASTDGRDGEMYFVVSPTIRQRRLIPVPAVLYKSGILAGYVPDLDATAVAIGKGDQIVSTILIMPGQQGSIAQGDDITDLQRRLLDTAHKDETWKKLLKSLIPRPGLEVQIPRFSHRSVINGTSALQRLGLRDLFDSKKANLAGLNGQDNDLHVSDMILDNTFTICGEGFIREQHHIETYPGETNKIQRRLWRTPHRPLVQDEFQAQISDVWEEPRDYQRAFNDPLHDTSYLMMPLHLRPRQARLPEAPPEAPRLKFDRPFMFFVRHNPTGLILHMGRYNPRLQP